jgi:hypothetical protein
MISWDFFILCEPGKVTVKAVKTEVSFTSKNTTKSLFAKYKPTINWF